MSASRWHALVNGRVRAGGGRLLIAMLLALILFGPAAPNAVKPALAATNPIVTENQQPGTGAWLIGSQQSDDANGQIKGYASATSVNQNQSIALFITTNPAQTYTIDFYRIGWYGGLGGRFRLHVGPLDGTPQSNVASVRLLVQASHGRLGLVGALDPAVLLHHGTQSILAWQQFARDFIFRANIRHTAPAACR